MQGNTTCMYAEVSKAVERYQGVQREGQLNSGRELTIQQHCVKLVISADYQQSKLIPNWGTTEQPGSTYYLQKVSRYLGHSGPLRRALCIHIFDERIGLKNIDHKVSHSSPCVGVASPSSTRGYDVLPSFSITPPVPTRIATYLPGQWRWLGMVSLSMYTSVL